MRCPQCGVINDDTSAFCYACGKELSHAADNLTSGNESLSTSNISPFSEPPVASNELEANKSHNNISETHKLDTDTSPAMVKPSGFRIGLALVVCLVIIIVYHTIGALAFKWKNGGGIILQLILWTIVAYVWRVITGTGSTKGE